MAKALLRAEDKLSHSLFEGDPVAIVGDDHVFRQSEDIRVWVANGNDPDHFPPTFYVLEIIGMPLVAAQRLYEHWQRPAEPGEPEYDAPDEADRCVWLGPHRWQLGVKDRLPAPLRNQLRQDRYLSYTYNAQIEAWLNSYIVDRCGVDVFINSTPIPCCGG